MGIFFPKSRGLFYFYIQKVQKTILDESQMGNYILINYGMLLFNHKIVRLVQERLNSSALAKELRLSFIFLAFTHRHNMHIISFVMLTYFVIV